MDLGALITFLDREGALALDAAPPWQTFDEEREDAWQLDLGALQGSATPLDEEWEIPRSLLADVLGGLRSDNLRPEGSVGRQSWEPRQRGDWDTCAWYQPLHFHGYGFGIYIYERCIQDLVFDILSFAQATGRRLGSTAAVARELIRAAVFTYFLHEHFHHKVECLAIRLHVAGTKPRYVDYSRNAYDQAKNSDDLLEEALANADAHRRLGTAPYTKIVSSPVRRSVRDYLTARYPLDPKGYRLASAYLPDPAWYDGLRSLHARVDEGTNNPVRDPARWALAPQLSRSFLDNRTDIWTIVPRGAASIFGPYAHRPAATCSGQQLVKVLEKHGYSVVKGGSGSHIKLAKRGHPTAIVPDHRELDRGTTAGNLKLIGATLHDLPGLLRK